jgi:hypothetical protein
MTLKGTKLLNEPILILEITPPSVDEIGQIQNLIVTVDLTANETLYLISDLSQSDLTLSELALGMAEISRNLALAGVFVVPVVVKKPCPRQKFNGRHEIPVFFSQAEALTYIRSLVALNRRLVD